MALMDLDELVDHWTLLRDALLLKFYARAGLFPRGRAELDDDAVAFVAQCVRCGWHRNGKHAMLVAREWAR